MGDAPPAPRARSLEDDAKLLDRLQRLSTSILERTRSVNTTVEELARASRVCEVRTRNTLNELLMLCNTQFVENRVYEEEGADPAEEKSVTETKEAVDVKARWEEALTLGVVALRQKVFYDEDEEEEEEAEDIYNSRPLPLIIGTRAYVASDSAGIGFAEEEEKDDIGEYSVEEEEDDGEEEEEEGDAEEEEEESIYDDLKREEAVEDDVFADAEVAAEDPEEKMSYVQSDIAARVAAQVMHQQEVRADAGPRAPPPMPRAPPPMPESTPDLFAPDDDIFARNDDPYDLFGGKTSLDHPERTDARSLLFGNGDVGLFEEDEDDAPPTPSQLEAATAFAGDQAAKPKPEEFPTDHPSFGGGLFGDDDLETLQREGGANVSEPPIFEDTPVGNASNNKNKTATRFDDLFSSFADDGDIFGAGAVDSFSHDAPAAKTRPQSTTVHKAGAGLFDEDDADDIFSSGGGGRMDSKGGIDNFFGSSDGGLFDIDNEKPADKAGDETKISGSSNASGSNALTSQGRVVEGDKTSIKESVLLGEPKSSLDRTNKHVTSSRGLFDDADDYEPMKSAPIGNSLLATSGGLFDDEPHVSGKAGGLFDDDSDEPLMLGRTQPVSSGDSLFDDDKNLHNGNPGGAFDDVKRHDRKDSIGSDLFGSPKAASKNKLMKDAVAYHETGIVAEEKVPGNDLFDTPQAVKPTLATTPSSSNVPLSAPKNVDTIPPPMPTNSRSVFDEPTKLEAQPFNQPFKVPADGSLFQQSATGAEPTRSSGLFDEPEESTNLPRLPTNSGLFDEPKNLDKTLSRTFASALFSEENAAAVENKVSAAPIIEKKKGGLGQFGDLKIDPTKLLPGAKPPPREQKGDPQQAVIPNGPGSTAPIRTSAQESTIDTTTIASRPVVAQGKRRPTTKKKFIKEPDQVVPTSMLAASPANASADNLLREHRATSSKPQAVNKPESAAGRFSDSRGLFEEPRVSAGLFEDVGAGRTDVCDDPPFADSSSKGIFADEPPLNSVTHLDDSPLGNSASKGLFSEEPPLAASKMDVHDEGEEHAIFAGQTNNQSLFDEPAAGINDSPSNELFAHEFEKPGFFDDPPVPSMTTAQLGATSGSLFDEKPASSIENLVPHSASLDADESSKVGIFDNPPSSKVAAQASVTSGELFHDPQSEAGGLFSDTPKLAGGLFSESAKETGGLFGDDVGADNLFSSATPKPPNSESVKRKTGGLFDDDDDLFGSSTSKGGLFG